MSSEEEEKKEVVEDLTNPDVVTKYREAGKITEAAMLKVMAACVPGAAILDLCKLGDAAMTEACGAIFKNNKKMNKGVGFPTCISVNEVVGHFCPDELDADKYHIKTGDVVKIDMGAHLDGYAAVYANTVFVGATEPVTGKAADVVAAAQCAAELAIRMVKAGNKNSPITEMFQKVADNFGVNVVQGVLSHEMNRNVIDGEKCILSKASAEQKIDEIEFDPNEVYAIDIVYTTGAGKPVELENSKPTVYKRQLDTTYNLKMKASRAVFNEVQKASPTFPFTIRMLNELKSVRFGLKECLQHNLIQPYPVLSEKAGEQTAHIKFTCLILKSGTVRLTNPNYVAHASEKKLTDPDLLALMNTSIGKKKKKNNKKKKKKAAE